MLGGTDRKAYGRQGESLAADFLQKKGWKIVAQNVRTRVGEIDILAEDSDSLVIVEVKRVHDGSMIDPVTKLDFRKRRKLSQLAQVVAMKAPDRMIRVDAITLAGPDHDPTITHYENIIQFS
jgi:putative endonuclease